MQTDTKDYRFIYKCRLCGAEQSPSGITGTDRRLFRLLLDAIYPSTSPNTDILSLLDVHRCSDDQMGVADFQGVRTI